MEHWWNHTDRIKEKGLSTTFYTTGFTLTGLGLNLDLSSWRPVTNHLSQGMDLIC